MQLLIMTNFGSCFHGIKDSVKNPAYIALKATFLRLTTINEGTLKYFNDFNDSRVIFPINYCVNFDFY